MKITLNNNLETFEPETFNITELLRLKNFTFRMLVIKVNDITTITANAIGDGLTYKWSATYGTFIGSGQQVQWTVCHQAKFTITCQVTDQNNNSETKQVVIRWYN